MKHRVCILTTVHSPFDVRIFHKQAKTLVQAGYEVTLIAPHSREERVDGVRLRPLGISRNRWHRMTTLTRRALRQALAEHAAVYHFHDPELIPVGLILKVLTSAKVVYDIHEDYPKQILSKDWMPAVFRLPVAKAVGFLERLVARFFDGLVAATPSIATRFPVGKTITVQNFPRFDEFVMPDGEEIPYATRPPWVAYVGGLSAERGAVEMVEAIGQVNRPVELIIAGKFDPPSLEKRVQALPGWQRVRFLGWQSREQVRDLFAQSRAGLVTFLPYPNHVSAQPNKMFEYMAAGLPVIASDFPLWRRIVEGERVGLLANPQDPQAIAQAIEWILTHPQEAAEMGRRGREAVRTRYNWEHEAAKLLALYERLLA